MAELQMSLEDHQAIGDRIASQVAADPRTAEWNADGGVAAVEFIREFAARSRRTPEQAEADRRAQCLRVFAAMNGDQA